MAAAAFYDLDGTLCRTNLVHAFAYNARNQQGLWRSVTRTASTVASIPCSWLPTRSTDGSSTTSFSAATG